MAILKDCGIVLKEIHMGESDKRLVLLTQKNGKITVFARGARKAGSKLAAGLFCYYEFVLYDGGNFMSVSQMSQIHDYGAVAADFDSYRFACYFLELADKMLLADMDGSHALEILRRALSELCLQRHGPLLVFAVYTFKFLQKEGYAPLTAACGRCGGDLARDRAFFAEGLLCDRCSAIMTEQTPMSHKTQLALNYILNAESHKIFAFAASPDVGEQLHQAALLFLRANVDLEFKSLEVRG